MGKMLQGFCLYCDTLRLLNKIYLELGQGACDYLTGIGHREASNLDREDAQKGQSRDFSLAFFFILFFSSENNYFNNIPY